MIKDGKIIQIHKIPYGRTDVFEIVNRFPQGYVVWPIGRHNFPYESYIPLGKPTGDEFHIDLGSLKALKLNASLADFLLYQASKSGVNKSQFEKMCKAIGYKL